MEFKFDAHQSYQRQAIDSVVALFEGQPFDASTLETSLSVQITGTDSQSSLDLVNEVGAIGNRLVSDEESVLQNLQRVQDANGLEVVTELSSGALDFDTEMETGTGKTYVYLRTIFELFRALQLKKE